MHNVVDIIRSDALVSRDEAVSLFSVLVPIIESSPSDEAIAAAGEAIARMPATDWAAA